MDDGFNCTCEEGFFGDGAVGVDSDECGLFSDETKGESGATNDLFVPVIAMLRPFVKFPKAIMSLHVTLT